MKQDLMSKLEKSINALEGKKVTKKQLEDLLLLQKQIDVVPTEVDVPVDEVLARYAITDFWEILKCKTCMVFHSTSGVWSVVRPSMADDGGPYYAMLRWYTDYRDERDKYSEEERETYDTLSELMAHIITLPLDVFGDLEFTINVGMAILKERQSFYTRLQEEMDKEHEVTEDDLIRDAKFEEGMLISEQLNSEIRDMRKNMKS